MSVPTQRESTETDPHAAIDAYEVEQQDLIGIHRAYLHAEVLRAIVDCNDISGPLAALLAALAVR